MRLSILIIAYNEERNIESCLKSVLNQTLKADEIVIIAHNCTDQTEQLIKKYLTSAIKLISYQGPAGQIFARIKGFEEVSGDIIACLDGDSVAQPDWLKELTEPFSDPTVVGTGGFITFTNSWLANLSSYNFFFWQKFYKPKNIFYFWGANFACRLKTYQQGSLKQLALIKDKIGLHYWAEDLFLALELKRFGKIIFTPKARIKTVIKESKTKDSFKKSFWQTQDYSKLTKYFKTLSK
ncbi:MAG: glycosyltransferase family 2 protein [Candidatus Komeilibacteria bacterium]|nr:glycosyltransferase family 2 protein [Candidatus Komeilibacteria bacterium]